MHFGVEALAVADEGLLAALLAILVVPIRTVRWRWRDNSEKVSLK